MNELGTALINGIVLTGVTICAALGLHFSFGLLGLVNLVHGEAMLLGGYAAFVAQDHMGSPIAGMLLAPIVGLLIGLVTEVAFLRRLYERPLDSLLVTFGLALVIREIVDAFFSNTPRRVLDPLNGGVTLGDLSLSWWRLGVVVLAVALCLAIHRTTVRTGIGTEIRAVVANPDLAAAFGIDGRRVRTLVFAAGSALAGLAGAVLAPLFTLDPQFGLIFLVNALVVVILGRLGSLSGLVVAAFGVGLATTLLQLLVSAVSAQILVLLAALVIIRLRSSLPQFA